MASTHPRTFVGKVKADAVSFEPIEDVLEQIRRKRSPDWAVFGFADQHASRNTLKVLAIGDGDLSDRSQWPPELFAPNSLCYGFMRFEFSEEETFAPVFISFCWKGRSLPIYLRTKYAEFNHVIRKHLKATNHMTLQHPDELAEGTFWQNMPPTPRRKRSHSRRFVTNDIEFTPEVLQVVKDIRSDAAPYNWMVCGYDTSDSDIGVQKIAVIDKGMAGLHALKGLGGITATLKEGATMYIYLRVDIPIHHNAERIVPKFVLVTWQGVDNGLFSDDESGEGWNSLSFSDGPPLSGPPLSSSSLRDTLPPTPSNSIVQRVMTAQKHGSEVTRFFPHHVHFSANSLSEITEETIRERVRRAVDNDCMLLRVVCIQRTGETQSPICVEVPFDATVALLRKEIASFVGIPEQQQQIVWIRQMDDFVNEFQRSTRAIVFNDNDAMLRTDIGLGHGDKIHVGDNADGEESILDKLVKQINSGTVNVSLSAERRHEVQQGVEAREAELQKILSATHDLLRKRVGSNAQLRPVTTRLSATQASEAVVPEPVVAHREVEEPGSNGDCVQQNGSTSPHSYASEDVSNLQEKARVLEEQNEYLEIPKESIRILGGKENELGCGKAATVYRGLWLNKNGAAEVAIKLFRYVRLTDKILGDYTTEVALLRKLKHPNIVLFIGACTDSKLMILTEYCSRKSLYEVIHTPNFATIPWQYKVRMMLDAARGIQYLHSRRIIHRDIKSHNFLVDDDWRVKVADFGISKILENDSTAYTQCGTTGWVAPEVLLDEDVGYTFKADNWSFAVVMWEMVADGLQNQFIGMAPIKFYNQTIHAGIRPPFPDGVDPEYVALINECWHSNASDRPPFAEIVARLEQMVLRLGGSIDLPPTYQGGYHHLTNAD